MVNELFKEINYKIVQLLVTSVKEDASYQFNLISIMQTEDIDGLLPHSFDKSIRKVIVRRELILSGEMKIKQSKKLVLIP